MQLRSRTAQLRAGSHLLCSSPGGLRRSNLPPRKRRSGGTMPGPARHFCTRSIAECSPGRTICPRPRSVRRSLPIAKSVHFRWRTVFCWSLVTASALERCARLSIAPSSTKLIAGRPASRLPFYLQVTARIVTSGPKIPNRGQRLFASLPENGMKALARKGTGPKKQHRLYRTPGPDVASERVLRPGLRQSLEGHKMRSVFQALRGSEREL